MKFAIDTLVLEWSIGSVLAVLFLYSLIRFFIPGLGLLRTLRRAIQSIRALAEGAPAAQYAKIFASDRRMSHLWSEFRETLHDQREARDGQMVVVAMRATAPADVYFCAPLVVDGRLRTEFFKNLPGLFTGVGIIGTFLGLISGLGSFRVSEDANVVRGSLETLMHSVGGAFIVSGTAICLAMVVTFGEKMLLATLYRLTEDLAAAIDARFKAGVGEEYLARMVRAAEASATEAKQLKNSLVAELGEILRELKDAQVAATQDLQRQLASTLVESTSSQIEEARKNNEALAAKIAESISEALKDPLNKIAGHVGNATKEQSAVASQMLQDIMSSFSQKLSELFGGQISGLADLNRQTADSVREVVSVLRGLAQDMQSSGAKSADDMARRLAVALEDMAMRQSTMNANSEAFIEHLKTLIDRSQTQSTAKLEEAVRGISAELAAAVSRLGQAGDLALSGLTAGQERTAAATDAAMQKLTGTLEATLKQVSEASATMARSVSLLASATSSSIDKLNAGADRLDGAATRFANSGNSIAGVAEQIAAVTGQLNQASGDMAAGSRAVQDVLNDYRQQRTALVDVATTLRELVTEAKREVGLTQDILGRIEGSAKLLGEAQVQADAYLQGLNDVLSRSHASFAEHIIGTLDKVNSSFRSDLSKAVGMLGQSISDLDSALSSAGVKKDPQK